MLQITERILLTLWVGSMWTAGYIVAPILFKTLDRSLAGSVAGHIFTAVNILGLSCAVVLLLGVFFKVGLRSLRQWRPLLLIAMLVIIVVGQFVLQPMMSELKTLGLTGAHATQFARLHGISSILFLFNSLGGLALVIVGLHTRD